ncbi:AAA family ATPase [Actinoplanes sp. GCM10030250]|uniref:AAA family ATPase n=1 Tax=Actinoplanes sp. GCM10030250 TaxID=3273376 RepID=UPI00360C5C5F
MNMLVERSAELEDVRRRLTGAGGGHGSVVVVSGLVAAGKTALLWEAADAARAAGMLVLHAQCSPEEQALEFGAVRQLVESTGVPPAGLAPAPPGRFTAQGVHSALNRLAERTPLLLVVDDYQHLDDSSAGILLYLARRVRDTRIVLLVGGSVAPGSERPRLPVELLRQPNCHAIRLGFLSEQGVGELLLDRFGRTLPPAAVTGYYRASGGNPLLLHALIDDALAAEPVPGDTPVPGESYAQAILHCLHRGGPDLLQAAAILAVLGDRPDPALLARMLRADGMTTDQALRRLRLSGLVDGLSMRHPQIRDAILGELDDGTRIELDLRAAHALYQESRPPLEVARHLLAAGRAGEEWEPAALQEAAEAAIAAGENSLAVACLELAHASADDDGVRNELAVQRADIKWRDDPVAALRDILPLRSALKKGSLDQPQALAVIRYLLRSGRISEAEAALGTLEPPAGAEAETDLYIFRQWLAASYPELHRRVVLPVEPVPAGVSSTADPMVQAVDLLAGVLRSETGEESIRVAEEIWTTHHVHEGIAEPAATVIAALVYADHIDTAEKLCERFLAETSDDTVQNLQGVLYAVMAQIALRRGDLPATVRYVRRAFAQMPAQNWGVGIGVPLACLLQAAALMGDEETAQAVLHHPVPDGLFQTRFGLHYRHARGLHYLLTGRHQAALREFLTCGSLMLRWGVDLPTLAPWRIDAARAYLELGKRDAAVDLLDEQERRPGAGSGRTAAAIRRLRAGLQAPERRAGMLSEAAALAAAGGDQVELAGVTIELARALGAIGEVDAAADAAQRAAELIERCGAAILRARLSAEPEDTDRAGDTRTLVGLDALTDAEWRVAVLAARGFTNRQVARTLFVTVSTVEQHLTRVYRKLSITRRRDLPRWLADVGPSPRPRPPEEDPDRPEHPPPAHLKSSPLRRLVLSADVHRVPSC